MNKLKVLVACEESQRVCMAFRELGHEAYSADIQEPSGGHPEWHILGDVLGVLNPKENHICFNTMDGTSHDIPKWDIIIAHPPCTYLTNSGNRWFNIEKYGDKARERHRLREEAVEFFMEFVKADCDHISIENPVGCMSTRYRKPNQIIQPYEYGHPERKQTCLWTKDLPNLKPTNIVEPVIIKLASGKTDSPWHIETLSLPPAERAKARSKTFQGIADAIAKQYSEYVIEKIKEKKESQD